MLFRVLFIPAGCPWSSEKKHYQIQTNWLSVHEKKKNITFPHKDRDLAFDFCLKHVWGLWSMQSWQFQIPPSNQHFLSFLFFSLKQSRWFLFENHVTFTPPRRWVWIMRQSPVCCGHKQAAFFCFGLPKKKEIMRRQLWHVCLPCFCKRLVRSRRPQTVWLAEVKQTASFRGRPNRSHVLPSLMTKLIANLCLKLRLGRKMLPGSSLGPLSRQLYQKKLTEHPAWCLAVLPSRRKCLLVVVFWTDLTDVEKKVSDVCTGWESTRTLELFGNGASADSTVMLLLIGNVILCLAVSVVSEKEA